MTKIQDIQKLLNGRTVLVISCGPSMKKWREVYDGYPIDNKPFVICVKQSINDVGDVCDMHILNVFNLQRYVYNNRPFVVVGKAEGDSHFITPKCDFSYKVQKNSSELDFCTAAIQDKTLFSNNMKFSNTPSWGPGIMYEFVIPFLVSSRVSEIVTVGWDIADENGKNSHYFDSIPTATALDDQIKPDKLSNWKFILKYKPVAILWSTLRCAASYVKYYLGKKVNIAGMLLGEAECISRSIPILTNWLNNNHIKIRIISESNWLKVNDTK